MELPDSYFDPDYNMQQWEYDTQGMDEDELKEFWEELESREADYECYDDRDYYPF